MRLLLLLFCLLTSPLRAQLYKPYQKPHRFAATAELGGINPVVAANLEYNPLQMGRCFLTLRVGIGHMLTKYSINTFPHAATVNLLLNRRKNVCPPPIGEQKQWFLELGAGGLAFNKPLEKGDYRFSPILGVRHYRTVPLTTARYFWKAQLTPLVLGKLAPWGGLGIGLIL